MAVILIFSTRAQAPSLYEQSLTAIFKKLEKEHSVEKVLNLLAVLPAQVGLHVVYRIILASAIYTLAERKEILEDFVRSHKLELTSRQRQSLELVRTAFIDRLIKRQKMAQVPNVTSIINERLNINGETPILKAVKFDDADLVYELIKAGAVTDVFDKTGTIPLFEVKSIEVLNVLLAGGANVHHVLGGGSPVGKFSVLHFISDLHMAELLIKAGVSLFDENNFRVMPCGEKECIITNMYSNALMQAATGGNFEVVRMLVERYPFLINMSNFYYHWTIDPQTVLDLLESEEFIFEGLAERNNKKEIIDYLISKGAKRFYELFPQGLPLDLFDIPLNELN
jgi:hypothetical protein